LATKDGVKPLKDELVTTKGALAAATRQLEQAQAENQASTTQLTVSNARVTELELKLDSSEQNVAIQTNQLKKSEQRLMSLSHQLADTRYEKDQSNATAQAKIQELEAECARSTELYKQALDAKEAVTRELENVRLASACAAEAANTQFAEFKEQLRASSIEIKRLQELQVTIQAELAATRGELSCENAKAASTRNEIDEKQAIVVSLQLSLKNEREEGRALKEDLAVERTKRRELETEVIESREKAKVSGEDKEKIQADLSGVYEAKELLRRRLRSVGLQLHHTKHTLNVSQSAALVYRTHNKACSEWIHKLEEDEAQWKIDKQRLETKVKSLEVAGDSLRLDILNDIQVYETKRKLSEVLDVGSPRQPAKRVFRNRSSSEASVAAKEEVEPF
jgi:chromosome segregation ATPase